jgi:probable rRNA maturation factor
VKTAKLSLAVQYACNHEALPSRPKIRRWVNWALKATAPDSAVVTVRFVAEEEGRELNRDYRGKDYATNVLSFAYDFPPELAGDLVLCLPVVLKEASDQGKAIEAHFAHLLVHGMLHLQGYDHEQEAEAEEMETLERKIMARMGYDDPYGSEQ